MNSLRIILSTPSDIDRAHRILATLPLDPPQEVTFRQHKSRRSLEQNARMWGMLTDVSKQVEWYGHWLTPEEWKDVFTAGLKRLKIVPGIDGGFVSIGGHTSKMTIAAMSDLMELMSAFGAERDVKWTAREEEER